MHDDPRHGVPALSFDRLTPLYDALARCAGFGERYAARVLAASGARDGETLLDLGAGTATLLILAKRRLPGVRAIGVDPDPRVLERARAKVRDAGVEVELIQTGAEAIPLADESVDLALSSLAFHHLPADVKRAAIAQVHRVLAPGGRFLLADFGPPRSIAGRALVGVVRALRLPEAATLRANVDGALPELLAETGFTVREAAPRYRGIDFLMATKDVSRRARSRSGSAGRRRLKMRRRAAAPRYRRSRGC